MDAKDFIKLLDNSQEVEKIPEDELKKLSMEYPYSQPVQLLYTIRLSQSSEYLFNRQLGKTAILTDDRSVLFDLFEREMDEAGTPTVISQPMDLQKKEVPQSTSEKEPLVTQLEATIKPEPPKEIIPEPSKTKPEPEVKTAAEIAPTPPPPQVKEIPKQKLDLTGLTPKEKVQAILAENKRVREEMASKKAGQAAEAKTAPVVPAKPAEPEAKEEVQQVEEPPVDQPALTEPQPPVYYPSVPESTYEQPPIPEEVSMPAAEFTAPEPVSEVPFDVPLAEAAAKDQMSESEVVEEKAEQPEANEVEAPAVEPEVPMVFTIDEDVPEPVFQIEDDEPSNPTVKSVVEALQKSVGKEPQDYSTEKHSFAEWLQILKEKEKKEEAGQDAEPETKQGVQKLPLSKKIELLDSFVEKLPEIKRKNLYSPPTEKPEINAGKYGGENDDMLVTETLAKVYISQRHYQKAIKAFEILKLKYPEKSSFFADQISEVRNLINSK